MKDGVVYSEMLSEYCQLRWYICDVIEHIKHISCQYFLCFCHRNAKDTEQSESQRTLLITNILSFLLWKEY